MTDSSLSVLGGLKRHWRVYFNNRSGYFLYIFSIIFQGKDFDWFCLPPHKELFKVVDEEEHDSNIQSSSFITFWADDCNMLTFDRAVSQETGASGRGCWRCHLDLWTGWIRCTCNAHEKQVRTANNYITKCHRRLGLVGISCSWSSSCSSRQWEPAPDRGLAALNDPRLSSPVEWEWSAAKTRGRWGQYVAVCSRLQLTSHTQPFRDPYENKVWEVDFSKEVCSFVIIVDNVSAYIYVYV